MRLPNIMIIGEMCSGKTFLARYLVNAFGYRPLSLATPIKMLEERARMFEHDRNSPILRDGVRRVARLANLTIKEGSKLLNIVTEQLSKIPYTDSKPRERCQFLGTEGGRKQIARDIWIRCLRGAMKEGDLSLPVVVDDVRFLNEFEALGKDFIPLKLKVSKVIRLNRLKKLYPDCADQTELLDHASEQEIASIPGISIDAGGSLAKMYREASEAIEKDDGGPLILSSQ